LAIGTCVIEEFDERDFRLGGAFPRAGKWGLDRLAICGQHWRILGVAERIDRVGQDLGVGEESLANDLAANERRGGEEDQSCGQERPDHPAGDRRAETSLPRRRGLMFIHSVKSFWSRNFLSFLASSARETIEMSWARR